LLGRLAKIVAELTRRTPEHQLAAIEVELSAGWSYRAYDSLRRLAEDGNAAAQHRLGRMFETAEGVIQNLADAVHWYVLAAEQGHLLSQARLGLIYSVDLPAPASLTPEDFARVTNGELPAGTMLEKLFPHGFAVTKDLTKAAKWNRLAAQGGAADAQARYGHQLALGLGVDRDACEAERWFAAAAAQGESAGQVGLGVLYAGGYGTPADHPRAMEWLALASETGNAAAQSWLAILLLQGEGVPRNVPLAIEYLKRAVAQDRVDALHLLGSFSGAVNTSQPTVPVPSPCYAEPPGVATSRPLMLSPTCCSKRPATRAWRLPIGSARRRRPGTKALLRHSVNCTLTGVG